MSYGAGTISFERGRYRVRIPDGKGSRVTIGSYLTEQEAKQALAVAQREKAQIGVGMTLRQIGPSYLKYERARGLKSWKQIESTWGSIVCDAPFIDLPIELVSTDQIDEWALSLPHKKKKRSVLRAGDRRTVELDKPISRKQAAHALTDRQRTEKPGGSCSSSPLRAHFASGGNTAAGRRAASCSRHRSAPRVASSSATPSGHDWGWADTKWNNRKGELQTRPGMPARAGVGTRIRFHDTRDTCATHLLSGTWGRAWSVKAVSSTSGTRALAVATKEERRAGSRRKPKDI
jgi:hypothetical protein